MIPRPCDLVVGRWGARYFGRHIPCATGRGGIGNKCGEGDGITPVGRYRIGALHLRLDRIAPLPCPVTTQAIGPRDIWSDDSADTAYNHHASAWQYPFSHEALRRADPLYDVVAVLDFNWPIATAGKGSAIFLHIWRKPRHPTEGCIAFAKPDLMWILSNWQSSSRVIIRP